MESALYGGPETVEHVYEREDDFQSVHVRRRDETDSVPHTTNPEGVEIWYTQVYDSSTGEMLFEQGVKNE
ncbi:MAG TPA: hypothetical protein VGH19_24105 [Verrucomicrobiae bacterium]